MRDVLLTFDNLGEAADLERGEWPPRHSLGRHPSVTRALPRLLDELQRRDLRATFFVEGLNCELYPDALRAIVARGHELAVHGWRHESWGKLASDRERELLTRATEAFERLGVAPRGFRPPGGGATEQTAPLLRELGYRFWSPSATDDQRATSPRSLATLAFDWGLVDAFHLMQRFADLRVRRGAPAQPISAPACGEWFAERLARDADEGSDVLILHPFLMLDEPWWAQVGGLLAMLAELRDTERVAVAPAGVVAARLGDESGH
ncbi:MAG: polysaccharide deacetylase family protein [Solirubrobacteraceae bacterium]